MKKNHDITLFILMALMYTTVCMETNIYVPAFPDMKLFFSTSSELIQRVLSINFLGICLGSLLFGPLSDSFGRKRILQLGLGVFALASWSCLFLNDFDSFLLCRFFQGIGAAAPMVICFAIALESYEPKKVAQICGGLNLFITGVMAGSPILGSILNLYFGWQANFLLIAVLATLSLLGSLCLHETLAQSDRSLFSARMISKNYRIVLTSFPFMGAALICYLAIGALIVFTANLSLIFIENLGVSKSSYGFYQAAAPATFALFSFLSIWIIERFGMEKTKLTGLFLLFLGTFFIMLTAYSVPNPVLICAAMVVITIGITFCAPIYGMESANTYPEMRGIATGMSNALRHIVVALLVGLGSYTFDGSIKPVAMLILISMVIAAMMAGILFATKRPPLLEAAS